MDRATVRIQCLDFATRAYASSPSMILSEARKYEDFIMGQIDREAKAAMSPHPADEMPQAQIARAYAYGEFSPEALLAPAPVLRDALRDPDPADDATPLPHDLGATRLQSYEELP